jgi:glycosyltransferase involved in cell wall biosynthesis
MKISIVTVSYNQAHFLGEALDSVLGQAYPELEYIVVDPGSKDGSRELIDVRAGQLAQRVYEPDRGAADGLNKGFARATGEIFGFLNADDVLYPGSLQAVAEHFRRHPECDIVFGDGATIDKDGKRLRHFHASNFTVERYCYGGAVWLQQSTFFRARAYHQSPGFNEANRTCWDGELFVSMVRQGARVGYLPKTLAGFRIHPESISGSGRLAELYRGDCRRIFRELHGREWNRADSVRSFVYRAASYALRKVQAVGRALEESQ